MDPNKQSRRMKLTGQDQNRLPLENGYDLLYPSVAIILKSPRNHLCTAPNTPHPFAQAEHQEDVPK